MKIWSFENYLKIGVLKIRVLKIGVLEIEVLKIILKIEFLYQKIKNKEDAHAWPYKSEARGARWLLCGCWWFQLGASSLIADILLAWVYLHGLVEIETSLLNLCCYWTLPLGQHPPRILSDIYIYIPKN